MSKNILKNSRWVIALIMAIAPVSNLAIIGASTADAAITPGFSSARPSLDTYISKNSPTNTYENAATLIATSSSFRSFACFDLSDIPTAANVSTVTLKLYTAAISTGNAGIQVFNNNANGCKSSGSALTYNNATAQKAIFSGTPLATTSSAPTAGGYTTISLPVNTIPANRQVSVGIAYSDPSTTFQFQSNEAANPPRLAANWTETAESKVLTFDSSISDSSSWAVSHRSGSDGIRWTNQDQQHPNSIIAINPDGTTLSTVSLSGQSPIDPEDLAITTLDDSSGTPTPYVSLFDGGGNNEVRESANVYRFVEPSKSTLTANPTYSVTPQKWTFNYPETGGNGANATCTGQSGYTDEFDPNRGVAPDTTVARGADSEAMLIDPLTGQFYFIIKEGFGQFGDTDASNVNPTGDGYYGVYAVKASQAANAATTPGTYCLNQIAQLPKTAVDANGVSQGGFNTTAASFAPDGSSFALRTTTRILVYKNTNDNVAAALNAAPALAIKPTTQQYQGEGLSYSADGRAFELSTEAMKARNGSPYVPATAVLREPLPQSYYVNPVVPAL